MDSAWARSHLFINFSVGLPLNISLSKGFELAAGIRASSTSTTASVVETKFLSSFPALCMWPGYQVIVIFTLSAVRACRIIAKGEGLCRFALRQLKSFV